MAMVLLAFGWLLVGFIVITAKPDGTAQVLFYRIGAMLILYSMFSLFGLIPNYLSNPLFTTYYAPRTYNLWGIPYAEESDPFQQIHYRATMDNPRWSLANNTFTEINDRLIGVRVAPPWTFDLTGVLNAGDNEIEVLVFNTLANEYPDFGLQDVEVIHHGELLSELVMCLSMKESDAALDAIVDLGRPALIQLAVLVDREIVGFDARTEFFSYVDLVVQVLAFTFQFFMEK